MGNQAAKIVDSTDEADKPEIDCPIVTVGGYIELFSALPRGKLPREVDIQNLEETEFLIQQICDFSKANMISFEFALDQTFVGSIEDGVPDRILNEGLIGEWRRIFGSSK